MRNYRCRYCGATFTTNTMQYYCSAECQEKALNHPSPTHLCHGCGKPYWNYKVYNSLPFCTIRCYNAYSTRRQRMRGTGIYVMREVEPVILRDPEMEALDRLEAELNDEPRLWEYPVNAP